MTAASQKVTHMCFTCRKSHAEPGQVELCRQFKLGFTLDGTVTGDEHPSVLLRHLVDPNQLEFLL